MKSPCIGCDFEHEDHNADRCVNCEKRIKYAEDQLMIPNAALEADRAAREETRKIREISPGKKRGPKPKHERDNLAQEKPSQIKEVKPKEKKAKRLIPKKGIYIRPTELCSDIQIQEIMQGVKEIANAELRSLPQQVLWILKERVEEWKEEHGAS